MPKETMKTKCANKRKMLKQNRQRKRAGFFLERGFNYKQAEMLARGMK